MFEDRSGTPTGLTCPDALRDWDAMTVAFLCHGKATPEHLGAILEASPDLALPVAVKGLFCILLGRREMTDEARRAANEARARIAAGDSSPRARNYLAALEHWLAGDPPAAIAALEQQLMTWPADTLTAKIVHGMRFMIGDSAGMLQSVDRLMPAHGDDHPYRGYMLGCRAFALEETGSYELAEAVGRAGLELARDDAWGIHAVAHVYDMTHRPNEGIALIDGHRESWAHCNNFGYHVWWHKALLHLDLGDIDTVLALYDDKIRRDKTDDYRDISNATSLLMRLELEGVDNGDRWEELADLSEARSEDGQLVFADLHYMLALIHKPDSEETARLRHGLCVRASAPTPLGAIAKNPGEAAVDGLAAFGEGQYESAFNHLFQAVAGLQNIGGSHAQRDVFERIAIDAGLRAGHLSGAEILLNARIAKRGGARDRFAETRLQRIAEAATVPASIPAQ